MCATDLLEHEVGCVNGDGSSGAVLLGLLNAREVDAHALTVHRLDLGVGERWGGEGAWLMSRCVWWWLHKWRFV